MPLVLPEVTCVAFLKAARECAEIARGMAGSAGDLTFTDINRLQEATLELNYAASRVAADASSHPVLVRDFINSRGGPAALGQVQTAVTNYVSSMNSWRTAVRTTVRSLNGTALVDVVARETGYGTLRTIEALALVPGASGGNTLRQHPDLAAAITALEALGA